MTTMVTWFQTLLGGRPVGADSFGNRYYETRSRQDGKHYRRWVIYKHEDEASSVPPGWHAWLHYTVDKTPMEVYPVARFWQRSHVPNRTGTASAYRPPGHTLQGGKRDHATGDYEPWTPN